MGVGFPLTYILCPSADLKLLTIGIGPMYGLAKLGSGKTCLVSNTCHVVAHGLITYVNVAILINGSEA